MPAPGSSGYRLTIAPAAVHLTGDGGGTYHGTVTVIDAGAPVKITVSAVGLSPSGPSCTIPHGAPAWLTLGPGPRSFILHGGQSHVITYTVAKPAGVADSAAVVAAAVPVIHVKAAAQLNVSAGSRITIGTAARCTPVATATHAPAAAQRGPAAGLPYGLIVSAAVLVLALLAVLVLARRHRRDSG